MGRVCAAAQQGQHHAPDASRDPALHAPNIAFVVVYTTGNEDCFEKRRTDARPDETRPESREILLGIPKEARVFSGFAAGLYT
jgi:hypothetical protein